MHTQTHFRPEARDNYSTKSIAVTREKHVRKYGIPLLPFTRRMCGIVAWVPSYWCRQRRIVASRRRIVAYATARRDNAPFTGQMARDPSNNATHAMRK